MDKKQSFDKQAEIWEETWYPEEVMKRICPFVAKFRVKRGACILNIGTKIRILPPLLKRKVGGNGKIFAMDPSHEVLKKVKKKKTKVPLLCIQADVENIPLPDDFCDHIICFAVFPNLSNQRKALLEMTRVLKHKGKILIAHIICA